MPKLVLVGLKHGNLVHPVSSALLGVDAAPCRCDVPGPDLVVHSVCW